MAFQTIGGMMTEYEKDCKKQVEFTNRIDLSNITNKFACSYFMVHAILREFAKAGYVIVTTDVDLFPRDSNDYVPFSSGGIILTKLEE